ncbi:MAG TPA: hypothetical protein VIN07_08265 [Flavipsychrobacter sp.]
MKKLMLLLSAMMLILSINTYAQGGAIGLRATPDGGGFTGKAYMSRYLAFEGQLNFGGLLSLPGESFTAVALLEAHIPLPDDSWRLIFGGGLHGGVWDHGRWYHYGDDVWVNDRPQPIFGLDAIGGVEYVFKNIPLGLSADIKPAINFTGGGPEFFNHNVFGLSARYVFR